MILKLDGEYKSLKTFISQDLNDFTIITGKNGSGKTQLLELINPSKKQNSSTAFSFSITPHFNYIQNEGIVITNSNNADKKNEKETIFNEIVQKLNEIKSHKNPILIYILDRHLSIVKDFWRNDSFIFDDPEYINILQNIFRNEYNHDVSPPFDPEINKVTPAHEKTYLSSIALDFLKQKLIYDSIQKAMITHKKNIQSLTKADIYNTPHDEILFASNNLFSSKMDLLIHSFAQKRYINDLLFFQKEYYKKDVVALSNEDFLNKYQKPWDLINKIFTRHNILFYVKEIEPSQFIESDPYTFSLYKKYSNNEIKFEDLSSGEKIIIGLILKLFTYENYIENLEYPGLLILDEPDAHLHPEMTKLLIDVLKDTFVKELGIKVIMTTHSPTTVALAPEESVYELKNGSKTSLEKVSKDYALNLLTSFIPTLKIDYKDRRYIFVEDEDDKKYYESIYAIHNLKKKFTSTLFFMGKGGCNAVKQNVETLLHNELENVYGIVDWDNKDTSEKNIFVHGKNVGYSLESYLYDPIYIMAILIEANYYNIKKKLIIPKLFNINRLDDLTNEELQNLVDWYFIKIKTAQKFNELKMPFSEKPLKINYHSGKSINIPEGYNLLHGHNELYPLLSDAFPLFDVVSGKKFNSIKLLNECIIKLIANNYPFVNNSTIELLEKLAS